jgi:hypothetical protein
MLTILTDICTVTGIIVWAVSILFILFAIYIGLSVKYNKQMDVAVGRCIKCSKCRAWHQDDMSHNCIDEVL